MNAPTDSSQGFSSLTASLPSLLPSSASSSCLICLPRLNLRYSSRRLNSRSERGEWRRSVASHHLGLRKRRCVLPSFVRIFHCSSWQLDHLFRVDLAFLDLGASCVSSRYVRLALTDFNPSVYVLVSSHHVLCVSFVITVAVQQWIRRHE